MKTFKNTFKKSIPALMISASLAGAIATPSHNANAGIIIGVAVPGVISALVGLSITSAGFFWGIQDEEKLNWKAAVLFVLSEKMNADTIKGALAQKYPNLDSSLADELSSLIVQESAQTEMNSDGMKKVVLSELSIASVLSVLSVTDPALGEQIRNDLTH
jgi:hypothetical protein